MSKIYLTTENEIFRNPEVNYLLYALCVSKATWNLDLDRKVLTKDNLDLALKEYVQLNNITDAEVLIKQCNALNSLGLLNKNIQGEFEIDTRHLGKHFFMMDSSDFDKLVCFNNPLVLKIYGVLQHKSFNGYTILSNNYFFSAIEDFNNITSKSKRDKILRDNLNLLKALEIIDTKRVLGNQDKICIAYITNLNKKYLKEKETLKNEQQ